jgi:hypothetical protein
MKRPEVVAKITGKNSTSYGKQRSDATKKLISNSKTKSKLTYDELYDHKTFETRQKLQQYGTENGRDKYHEDIWVRGIDIQIETFSRRCGSNSLVIICDIRFPNEFEYVKSKGGKNIRIISPNRTNDRYFREAVGDENKLEIIKNHRSEVSLDNHNFDYIIKNDYNNTIDIDYEILI